MTKKEKEIQKIESKIATIESAIKIMEELSIENQDKVIKNNEEIAMEKDLEKKKALEAENERLVGYIVMYRGLIDNESKTLAELKTQLEKMKR
jgi:hypothetical protein